MPQEEEGVFRLLTQIKAQKSIFNECRSTNKEEKNKKVSDY